MKPLKTQKIIQSTMVAFMYKLLKALHQNHPN